MPRTHQVCVAPARHSLARLPDGLEDEAHRLLRLVPVREVTAVGEPVQRGVGEELQRSGRLARQRHPVVATPADRDAPDHDPTGAPSCLGPCTSASNCLVEAGRSGEVPQLLQHQVRGEPPRLRRELQQQCGAADRSCWSARAAAAAVASPRRSTARPSRRRSSPGDPTRSRRGSSATTSPRWPRRAISSTMRAPIELPTTSTAPRPCSVMNCLDGIGQGGDGDFTRQRWALAEAREIDCDHRALAGQRRDDEVPVVQVGDAVHEQQRLAGSGSVGSASPSVTR